MKGNAIGILLKKGMTAAKSGSPVILAGLAAAGVVTTAIFAVKATKKAEKRIDEALEEKKEQVRKENEESDSEFGQEPEAVTLTKKEIVKAALPSFVPAIIMGALTIMCILGGLNISMRRQAALTAAYNISESVIKNYEKALPEVVGEEKAAQVKEKVAQNQILTAKKDESVIEPTGTGNQLCFDTFTGRYFRSTAAHVQKIVNDMNEEINRFGYVCLNDFYSGVGLRNTEVGDMLGWGSEGLIDVGYSSQLTEDNEPVLAISFLRRPITDYDKFGC